MRDRILIPFCLLITAPCWTETSYIYVDADAVGANDGSSWTDAFIHLQDALAVATSGDVCAGGGARMSSTTYDANGFIASRTDANGNVTTTVNNDRGLQESRTEAVGTPEERTITTTLLSMGYDDFEVQYTRTISPGHNYFRFEIRIKGERQ